MNFGHAVILPRVKISTKIMIIWRPIIHMHSTFNYS